MTQTVAPAGQPDALEHFDDIISRMAGRRPALFLDYDGTLVPLARRPELAIAPPELLKALSRLADLMPVAVVTGRGRPDVMRMLGVKGIAYAGSHGFDIVDAEGNDLSGDIGDAFLPALKKASLALAAFLDPIDGAFLEDKIYSLAIHYREVLPERHGDIAAAVEAEAARHPTLKKAGGKMIHELRPDMEWNKGTAILHVMEAMGLTQDTCMPFYIGDDETDEDGFRAIRDIGVGIKVGADTGATAARFTLQSPEAVGVFLRQLTDSHSQ
ncbi:Trehalose-6-phosphate phosphatase (EC 3.1.3.12) [Candidatus Phaeomarinobacter ectocarpi]|uniref:Trehalose 6-phosphate phosphatase n=1 Tax=Candidatus Phaeomarinibacter ectocarpi TaxID=1458461 RepID=X5MNR7_9HYPH|nr:trehalose-phosphatase [Candidatus Phaeomarinobacter ectocarpi]CDO60341.1 Trehalose-6-phosphate phosphatase (EC 3.1.3.12) [Candidatus Phaeomarinobacter ectocarpi]